MQTRTLASLHEVAAADWNALNADDNPFLRHEFLLALEDSGCVGADTGWLPRHLVAEQDGHLIGAVPLYLKSHSYGEYVFDWSWAEAYTRAGLRYYPKLVAAVPFTPVTGSRLLTEPGADSACVRAALIDATLESARDSGASSLHWLFTSPDDNRALAASGLVERRSSQFHWCNRGYDSFAAYLADFSSDKRKKVHRERRLVREAGVRMEVRAGRTLDARELDLVYDFYHLTVRKHGAIPYLNRAFFHLLGEALADRIVVVFAYRGAEVVACAFSLRSRDALYGRYWGGDDSVANLHFETCYYTPIEYCIEHGLARFEAGAQGGHKLARGLEPVVTTSMHWLAHDGFSRAVQDFLRRERDAVMDSVTELGTRSPFKKSAPEYDVDGIPDGNLVNAR